MRVGSVAQWCLDPGFNPQYYTTKRKWYVIPQFNRAGEAGCGGKEGWWLRELLSIFWAHIQKMRMCLCTAPWFSKTWVEMLWICVNVQYFWIKSFLTSTKLKEYLYLPDFWLVLINWYHKGLYSLHSIFNVWKYLSQHSYKTLIIIDLLIW